MKIKYYNDFKNLRDTYLAFSKFCFVSLKVKIQLPITLIFNRFKES